MSLVIRSAKTGKKGESKFRIVVKEKRDRRDGNAVEYLGWYEKKATGVTKVLKKDRIDYWISKGAQPSDAIKRLLTV